MESQATKNRTTTITNTNIHTTVIDGGVNINTTEISGGSSGGGKLNFANFMDNMKS